VDRLAFGCGSPFTGTRTAPLTFPTPTCLLPHVGRFYTRTAPCGYLFTIPCTFVSAEPWRCLFHSWLHVSLTKLALATGKSSTSGGQTGQGVLRAIHSELPSCTPSPTLPLPPPPPFYNMVYPVRSLAWRLFGT